MTKENRICYFGTRGQAGHSAHPIVGNFTREELENICNIDCDHIHSFISSNGGFCYGAIGEFLFYAIQGSKDDKRPGCITAIFVEFAKKPDEIKDAIMSNSELQWRFDKRLPQEKDNQLFFVDE